MMYIIQEARVRQYLFLEYHIYVGIYERDVDDLDDISLSVGQVSAGKGMG